MKNLILALLLLSVTSCGGDDPAATNSCLPTKPVNSVWLNPDYYITYDVSACLPGEICQMSADGVCDDAEYPTDLTFYYDLDGTYIEGNCAGVPQYYGKWSISCDNKLTITLGDGTVTRFE